jgi:hypothetical protein
MDVSRPVKGVIRISLIEGLRGERGAQGLRREQQENRGGGNVSNYS